MIGTTFAELKHRRQNLCPSQLRSLSGSRHQGLQFSRRSPGTASAPVIVFREQHDTAGTRPGTR
jgi:hypothetical protein